MDNLLDLNCNELTEYIKKFGHKPYRAKQLLKWIYHFGEKYFSKMKNLAERIDVKELSMGMSNDYLEAAKYGATYLRIGSKIFGNRN